MFPNPRGHEPLLTSPICQYQNITCGLVFTIMFRTHCNFFIVLPVRLKICRSNDAFFTRQNVRAQKIGCVPGLLYVDQAHNFSRPDVGFFLENSGNEMSCGI